MMGRFGWIAVLVAMLAGGAWAGEPVRGEDGRVVVDFWHGMGGDQGRAINEISDLFNKSQEKYRAVAVYQGRYDSLAQKLIAACYARRNPAVSQMYPGWSTRFHRFGYLKTITEFAADDADFREKALPDFYPVMLEENTMPNPASGELEVVTLPFNKSVYVLFVNQTRMEKLGWTHPPRTWAEFRKLAEEMTVVPEGGGAPTTYGFATRTFIEDFTVQAFSAGTQLLDEESGEILVDSPAAVAALDFLHSMVMEPEPVKGAGESEKPAKRIGYVESGYLNAVFGSERIGMYIASTASFRYNDQAVGNKFIWSCYPIPSRDAETPGKTLMQGTNVGIFAGLPAETEAGAWEFVKFLTSPEMTALWGMRTGYMPVRRSAGDLPEFRAHLEKDVRYANAMGTLENAAYEPRLIYWETVRSALSREVDSVMFDRRSTADALAAARRAIEDAKLHAD